MIPLRNDNFFLRPNKTITETVTEVSEITTESVEEVDLVGPEEEVIVTERETFEITEW